MVATLHLVAAGELVEALSDAASLARKFEAAGTADRQAELED